MKGGELILAPRRRTGGDPDGAGPPAVVTQPAVPVIDAEMVAQVVAQVMLKLQQQAPPQVSQDLVPAAPPAPAEVKPNLKLARQAAMHGGGLLALRGELETAIDPDPEKAAEAVQRWTDVRSLCDEALKLYEKQRQRREEQNSQVA